MYRVIVERSAEKDLRRLPLDVRFRVVVALRGLANDPRPVGSRKLAGTKHGWRIRIGGCRVIYEIADSAKIVRVLSHSTPERGLSLMFSGIRLKFTSRGGQSVFCNCNRSVSFVVESGSAATFHPSIEPMGIARTSCHRRT